MIKQLHNFIGKLTLFLTICCGQLCAQHAQESVISSEVTYSEEFVHQARALYDWKRIEKELEKQLHIDHKEVNLFLVYMAKKNLFTISDYLKQVRAGTINSSNATAYWLSKVPDFEKIYQREKNNLHPQLAAAPAVSNSASCNNLDFTSGTANWVAKWCGDNVNGGSSTNYTTLPVDGFNSSGTMDQPNYVHEVMTAGTDPYVPISKVPPGHTNSIRLGSAEPMSGVTFYPYNHQMIRNTFTVSAANPAITYWYAVVFNQAIQDAHESDLQPYFNIRLFDENNNEIKCASYDVNITNGLTKGFKIQNIDLYLEAAYTDWVPVYIPLIDQIGKKVTIQFESSDCMLGAHFGYAYVAVDCNPFEAITTTPYVCGSNSIQLIAPLGATSYSWTGPGVLPPTNAQTVTVNQPGKYAVTMSVIGNGGVTCKYTLDTVIAGNGTIPVALFSSTAVCLGNATVFADESTSNGSITEWNWDFNNDGIIDSKLKNPTYLFTYVGTFPVKLTVKQGFCEGTITKNVIVGSALLKITEPPAVCAPNIVDLTATSITTGSDAGALTYWKDATATIPLPAPAAVNASGVYYIKVTTPSGCMSIQPVQVRINPLPVALAGDDVTICSGVKTAMIGTAPLNGYSYQWTPATGLTDPTIANPGITAINPDATPLKIIYTLTTVITSTGCQAMDDVEVVINPQPLLVITNPAAVCAPLKVDITLPAITLNSSSIAGGTFTYWKNATATDPLPSAKDISQSGIYYIKVNALGGCEDIKPVTIVIQPLPVSNAGPDQVICTGDAVTLGSAATQNHTYSWTPQTGLNSGTIANPTVTLTNLGKTPVLSTFIVTTTNSQTGCTSSDTVHVTVNSVPTVNAGSVKSVCSGNPVLLSGSFGGSAISASWSGGQGTFEDKNNVVTLYTPTAAEYASGTVTLTLTTNDPDGPCAFASSDVVLNFYKSPNIKYTVDRKEGCPVHCVNFSDSSFISDPADFIEKWSWNFGDPSSSTNTSGLQNPEHCYSTTGTYDVSLKVTSNHGCTSSLKTPRMIRVFAIPVAEFTPTPNPASVLDPRVTFINGSSTDVVYWSYHFGDGDSGDATVPNPVHLYPAIASMIYTATLDVKNADGCVNRIEHTIEIGPEFTFYIPNAFTPDGDGVNDFFFGKGIGIVQYDLSIFDRWGNLIFHSDKLEDAWNGKANNGDEIAQQDVFVWKVTLKDVFDKKHHYIGTVTLVK